MRVAVLIAAVTGVFLVTVGAGSAQAPAPTVTITASNTALTVGASGPLAPGPTRFDVVKSGGGNPDISIAALRPGITMAAFTAALRSNPEDAIDMVHLDGGATVGPNLERRAVTM